MRRMHGCEQDTDAQADSRQQRRATRTQKRGGILLRGNHGEPPGLRAARFNWRPAATCRASAQASSFCAMLARPQTCGSMMTKMSSKGHGKVRTRCGNAAEVLQHKGKQRA